VIPGDGSVTISSEDPEALRQFEELLRALAEQRGALGRNYNIHLLRNAKASEVAATIQRLFRTPGTGRWSTGVVAVADERLNAVVAYAPRSDRQTVEALIKVLDSNEVPEALGSERLTLIPVKNTDASRIVGVLKDLYKTQVEGFSVEEKTNSLVVTAPPALADEIRLVVERLDEAAGSEPSRGVRLVPLQKTSAARMQKALNLLLQEPARAKR
jgi:type II secretory pathway component GspD/PulD (secretin)